MSILDESTKVEIQIHKSNLQLHISKILYSMKIMSIISQPRTIFLIFTEFFIQNQSLSQNESISFTGICIASKDLSSESQHQHESQSSDSRIAI